MAEATKTVIVDWIAKEREGINLTLTDREALVLATVLSRVGGNRNTSHRKETQAIMDALEETGTNYFNNEPRNSLTGHLVFQELDSFSEDF